MQDFFIILHKDSFENRNLARAFLNNIGISIVKDLRPGLTFRVTATTEQLDNCDEIKKYSPVDLIFNFQEEIYDQNHLSILTDPENPENYTPQFQGKDQVVYIVDSGVNKDHDEFQDTEIHDLFSVYPDNTKDNTGHGTGVASMIVGKNIGVSPKATLKVVKLFDSLYGQISLSDILESFDSIGQDHEKNPRITKAVCLPWVVDSNDFLDARIQELNDQNIVVVCSAGNQGTEINNYSPARIDEIITVGAHDKNFSVTKFTNSASSSDSVEEKSVNYGAQLDIFAPGVDISIATNSDSGYATGSGTSFSAGIVAGVVLHYIEKYPRLSSHEIKQSLLNRGTLLGEQLLSFDQVDSSIDYNTVNKIITVTDNTDQSKLSAISGRIMNIQVGLADSVDLGLNPSATDISVLDFAAAPSWINVDTNSGIVSVDTSNLDDNVVVPGIYIFAVRGSIDDNILVEEYSVGIYQEDETELEDSDRTKSYYYDTDFDDYDQILDFELASQKP